MTAIPAEYRDLFEGPAFAHAATLLPDGMPHVTPTWVDADEGYQGFDSDPGPRVIVRIEPEQFTTIN